MRLALASLLLATGCLHQDTTADPDHDPGLADRDELAAAPTSGPAIEPGLAPGDDPVRAQETAGPDRAVIEPGLAHGDAGSTRDDRPAIEPGLAFIGDGARRDLAAPPHRATIEPGLAHGEVSPPRPLGADGTYSVRSQLEITAEALLPGPAAELVATVRDFSEQPAHTLFTLAEEAGVPAVGTLRSVLPGYLEDRLEGWIDDELAGLTLGGVPVTQLAENLVAYAETALTQVELESTLTLAGGLAQHRLTALDLAPAGLDVQLALGGLPDEVVTATATAAATGPALTIGEHVFALPYGRYVWDALEARFAAEHGMGVRAALGAAVRCPVVAARVAEKCVLGVCVGHAAELTSLCERGLDEVVDQARAKLASFRFDAVRLAGGTATLVDLDADHVADELTGGVWSAEIDAGMGLRSVPATFAGSR